MNAPDPNRWGVKAPKEITADRYEEMLGVLPPSKWRGIGEAFESFHVSERLSGDVVSWFVRINDRYFQCDQLSTIPRAELETMVRAELGRIIVRELTGGDSTH